jgi:hypothetical protein
MTTKLCHTCGEDKDLEDFPPSRWYKTGRGSKCTECFIPDSRAQYAKYEKRTMTDEQRDQRRARVWGLTVEDAVSILEAQGGVCAICQKEMDKYDTDHDHVTGAIRGFLCRKCNLALGLFGDDVEVLRRAVAYLDSQVFV